MELDKPHNWTIGWILFCLKMGEKVPEAGLDNSSNKGQCTNIILRNNILHQLRVSIKSNSDEFNCR